jgi:glycosyltransferase involved in cell wall biosynthesis
MKILMTADTVGGVWTYAMELARAAGPDLRFIVATMGALPSDAQWAEVPPNTKVVASEYKLEWMDDPWDDVARAAEWLLTLEDEEAPDVVHLNGYAHGALPFRAPKLVVGHSCVLSWWRAVKGNDAPPEWDRYRQQVERGLRGADAVVAPSAWMLGALHEHYRFDAPSKLIYNGTRLAPRETKQSRIFAAGRMWDEAKNMKAVVDAASSIRWPVRIAGDGAPLGRLGRDDMERELGAASIYLFPALYEPFGLSILEAALAGCALVIGDIPSLHEVWRDAAIFVPPRNAAAIAGAVNEIIANDDFRAELARRARRRASELTPERMAAGYREMYASLHGGEALMPVPSPEDRHEYLSSTEKHP